MLRVAVFFVLFLLQLQDSSVDATSNGGFGFKATLRRLDANKGYTAAERLDHAFERSKARVARLAMAPSASAVAAPVHASSQGEYLVDLGIDTPPQFYSAVLDISHDLVWTQCAASYFDAAKSATYRPLPCSARMCYGLEHPACVQGMSEFDFYYVNSSKPAVLATETFTFGSDTVPSIAFGCIDINRSLIPGSGMVGLGRGAPSLVRQLGSPRFSYCLGSYQSSEPGRLYVGQYAMLSGSGSAVRSTPILTDPDRPSYYFLNMTGISVGGYRLPIDSSVFAMDQDYGFFSGVIIDTFLTISSLVQPAYDAVRAAFVAQVKLPQLNVTSPGGVKLCFVWPPPPRQSITLPQLVFHLDGADMELPLKNYMMVDERLGGLCLAMGRAGDVTVIGTFQQQNFHMLYDLSSNRLSFAPEQCNQL